MVVWLQTEEQALQRALEMSLADSRPTVQPTLRWVNPIIQPISYYELYISVTVMLFKSVLSWSFFPNFIGKTEFSQYKKMTKTGSLFSCCCQAAPSGLSNTCGQPTRNTRVEIHFLSRYPLRIPSYQATLFWGGSHELFLQVRCKWCTGSYETETKFWHAGRVCEQRLRVMAVISH